MMGEFSRLQEVDHPNVLSLIGCKRHLDTIFLFYEYFLRCQPLEGYIKVRVPWSQPSLFGQISSLAPINYLLTSPPMILQVNRLDDAIVIAMLRQIVEGLGECSW